MNKQNKKEPRKVPVKNDKGSAKKSRNNKIVSPFRYQLTFDEFEKEWGCSYSTIARRKSWAQDNYKNWRKVFLYGGMIDLKEYQKFNTYYSDRMYEEHLGAYAKEAL